MRLVQKHNKHDNNQLCVHALSQYEIKKYKNA